MNTIVNACLTFSCQSFLDLGLALSSMVVGFIVDRYGFLKLEIFFVSWLFCKYHENNGIFETNREKIVMDVERYERYNVEN